VPESQKIGRVRQALRSATAQDHERVDALFADFSLNSAPDYAAFLTAHARALAPLEAAAVPDATRIGLLADDLATLGEAMPAPLPMAQQGGEAFQWGLRYALEGSRLGGGYLARKVAPGLPVAYLSAVHEKGGWAAFQARLDAAAEEQDDAWIDEAVRGARVAFDLFAQAGSATRLEPHG
jgi:heme oxygenase